MIPTHFFADSGSAYDATQCDERIKNGDTLVIVADGVIGIAGTWPFAVTVETGSLHAAHPRASINAFATGTGLAVDQIRAALARAIDIADTLDYEVNPAVRAMAEG